VPAPVAVLAAPLEDGSPQEQQQHGGAGAGADPVSDQQAAAEAQQQMRLHLLNGELTPDQLVTTAQQLMAG